MYNIYYYNQCCVCLGGYVAEKVFFHNKLGNGAFSDMESLEHLTTLILDYGTLSGITTQLNDFCQKVCYKTFKKRLKLIRKLMHKTTKIIKKNKKLITTIADELYKKDILSPDEIKSLLK